MFFRQSIYVLRTSESFAGDMCCDDKVIVSYYRWLQNGLKPEKIGQCKTLNHKILFVICYRLAPYYSFALCS